MPNLAAVSKIAREPCSGLHPCGVSVLPYICSPAGKVGGQLVALADRQVTHWWICALGCTNAPVVALNKTVACFLLQPCRLLLLFPLTFALSPATMTRNWSKSWKVMVQNMEIWFPLCDTWEKIFQEFHSAQGVGEGRYSCNKRFKYLLGKAIKYVITQAQTTTLFFGLY